MSKSASIFAHVEPEVKERAEAVLDKLGISMSNAIDMFLRQVDLQQGLPFEVRLPEGIPISCRSLTNEQFEDEVEAGIAEATSGKLIPADDVEADLMRDFGICVG